MKDYADVASLLLDSPLTRRGHVFFVVHDHDRRSVADYDVSGYTPSSPAPEIEITDHYTPSTPPDFDITDDQYTPSSPPQELDNTDHYTPRTPLPEFDVRDQCTPDSPPIVPDHYTPSTPPPEFDISDDHYTPNSPPIDFDITDHYTPSTPLPEFHGPDNGTLVLSKRQRLALDERDWRSVTKKHAVRSDPCSGQSWLEVRHKTTAVKRRPSTPHPEFDFSDCSTTSTPLPEFNGPDHCIAPFLSKRQRLALDERDWRSVTKKHAVRSDPCSGQSWLNVRHKDNCCEAPFSDHSNPSTHLLEIDVPDHYTAPFLSNHQSLALDERDWWSVSKKHAVRSDPCSGQSW